jgi:hypothetical protein
MNTDGDGFKQAMAGGGEIKTRRGERRGEGKRGEGGEGGDQVVAGGVTLSHLVWFSFKSGWETKRCQMTAWKASLCGVMLAGLTVGTMTQAWATLAA